jgi:competence protein ComEC
MAKAMDLEARSLTVLSTVVLLMLSASPLDIVNAGFWLTCGATLGILLHAAPMMRRIREWRSPAGPEVNVDVRIRPALAPVLLVIPAVMAIAAAGARRCLAGLRSVMEMLGALVIATLAAELLLLPITAIAFSQITVAGLVLNMAAIPLMTIVQLAGMMTLVASSVPPFAALCGTIAHVAAVALVRSADLVDLAPWTVMRVAPPPLWLVCAYFLAWAGLWIPRVPARLRIASGAVWIGCLGLIAIAPPLPSMPFLPAAAPPCESIPIPGVWRTHGWLRLTMIDVGQGAAAIVQVSESQVSRPQLSESQMLMERMSHSLAAEPLSKPIESIASSRRVTNHVTEETMLVDAGGTMSEGFDVGGRVVSPALWALGIRRLSVIALTHGDIDHIGGAPAVIDDFHPRELWLGDWLAAGDRPAFGEARVEVWSPSDREPAAARTGSRGRNDHSLVMEIRLGDVSIVLPGDISAEVERRIVDRSRPSPFRVLLAPHHGSRSSSSELFLDALAPRVVLVSAGLGNRHGHPSPVVLDRYRARGIIVFRTDLDGAVQLLTDGHDVRIKACAGRELHAVAPNGGGIEDVGPAAERLRRPHRPQSGAVK